MKGVCGEGEEGDHWKGLFVRVEEANIYHFWGKARVLLSHIETSI